MASSADRFDAAAFLQGLVKADGSIDQPPSQLDADIGPDDLPPEWYDHWAERSAIREFDGHQAREVAEFEALQDTIRGMRRAGVSLDRGPGSRR